jgi:hypothetical protein
MLPQPDAGSIVLTEVTAVQWLTHHSSDNIETMLKRERCHNQFRVIRANITEVNTTNLKGSVTQKDEVLLHHDSATT